jgi:hypothetical protein
MSIEREIDSHLRRLYLGAGDRDQIKIRDTDAIAGGTCQPDKSARVHPEQLQRAPTAGHQHVRGVRWRQQRHRLQ